MECRHPSPLPSLDSCISEGIWLIIASRTPCDGRVAVASAALPGFILYHPPPQSRGHTPSCVSGSSSCCQMAVGVVL
ncbi:hypothetical protein INR49_002116 [Caranx melampygus]|nr:hypothetical protein INR49_002116 [Caranx melampygus]